MSQLDQVLKSPSDAPSHPKLRRWKSLRNEGVPLLLEVRREDSALGSGYVTLYVVREDTGECIGESAWDADMNLGLIALRVRAVDAENETLRFSLGLRDALGKTAQEYGDGYFNSVLKDLIDESSLVKAYRSLAEVMELVHALPVEHATRKYQDCREMIASEVGARMNELKTNLGYGDEEALRILADALAQYLDGRFSVTARRRMGLL